MARHIVSPARRRAWQGWSWGQLLIYLVLFIIFLLVAYPFFYVISLAVMPYDQYVRMPVHYGPSGFTLSYFQQIFSDARLVQAYRISVAKTLLGTTLNVVVTVMAGYVLSRQTLYLKRPLGLLFAIPLFFSGGLIPFYLVVQAVGLLNTYWALILPTLVIPFFLFIVRAYFSGYPQEIIEAATIDGASQIGTFWRIVWPTSTPIVATMALLYGTTHWNDYFWPSILVQPDLHPAIVVLRNAVANRTLLQGLAGSAQRLTPESYTAAVAAAVILPILIVYPFLQRYIVKGILVGSIKG